jgi:MraZ protein
VENQNKYFIGNYLFALDNKDRFSIPARFRRILSEEAKDCLVITRGFVDRCIQLFPRYIWDQFIERYKNILQSNKPEHRSFTLWLYRDSFEYEIDKQGRIPLPKVLLNYAKIKKEILIIGVNSHIEIWNPQLCNERIGEEEEIFLNMVVDL